MPTYFEIKQLADRYTWHDFDIDDMAFEYAVDVLEIPEEYIDEVSVIDQRLEITLVEAREIAKEDWYYALLPFSA